MLKNIFFGALVLVGCWSCRPEPDNMQLLDELVVSTNFDPAADFSEYATYVISKDTIGFVSNTDPKDTIRVYSTNFQYPRKVIEAVETDLNVHFEKVERDDDPDLGINIYVVSNLNLFQEIVYPSYYSYYYGYSGYYYYPYIQTYASNTATLVVEIIDLKNRGANNQVKVVWNAYMGDVINSVNFEQQSVDAIHQAFDQSPYLGQ
ncbi:MAG TPA: DUF4136 domain-containing protein [Ohtaekwangia sp.]|nr:DUF4136 domain-containing protein [Ohtaekwangia sp.]